MTEAINFTQTQFLVSARALHQCPVDEGAEVAFAGRSNAGKSSAINTLTHQAKLARTSKTPGRTQLINFFSLDESRRLVDLPGYGYAKVPVHVKKEWDKHLAIYLQERKSLKALVLLMDIRQPLQPGDWQMIQWANACHLPIHLLLTKADKLKKGPARGTLLQLEVELRRQRIDNFSAQLFSALKKVGIQELETFLKEYLNG